MLDIKFVRENPDAVKENIKKKFQEAKLPLVDQVIALDAENRAAISEASSLRAERNALSKKIGALMGQAKKDPSKLEEAEAVKAQVAAQAERLKELEAKETELEEKIKEIMYTIPQMIDPSVPIGPDDSCNVEVQRFGEATVPSFEIPYHTEIMESFNGIDLDSARRVAGNGFYYLMGDIARLHEAVLAYARDFMINKGFTYVIPPFMMHGDVVKGVMSFPEMDAMMYKIEGEDLYLQPLLPQGEGRPRHRGARRVPHPSVREAGDDRGLQARGQHDLVRQAVEEQRGAVPQPGHPRASAGVLQRRPGRPEGEELRHRGLEPPSAEVLRGVQLLQPGRCPGPPPAHPHQGCRRQELSGPHPEQHLRGPAPYADRLPGEQPA